MPDTSIYKMQEPSMDLEQWALQQVPIRRVLDVPVFARQFEGQIRQATKTIIEQNATRASHERLISGIEKAVEAIVAQKVKIFVSYKRSFERETRALVQMLKEHSASKLDIWFDGDITAGQDWMDAIFDAVTGANWFLLLMPDPREDLDWPLYEAGIFRASMRPGDRLICIHHPDVPHAPQLDDYQAVAAKEDELQEFLQEILVSPGAVPGMAAINPAMDDLKGRAAEIAGLFRKTSGAEPVWLEKCVELEIDNPKQLKSADDLKSARIVHAHGVSTIFNLRRGIAKTWGELIDRLDPDDHGTAWIDDLVTAIVEVADGGDAPQIETTFAAAGKEVAGKEYRPSLQLIKQRGDCSIESFHIGFLEELGPGQHTQAPQNISVLQTALRLAYRFRWEVTEPYSKKSVLKERHYRAISHVFDRLEREAHHHGLVDRDILIEQFEAHEAIEIVELCDAWLKLRAPDKSGLLDQGLAERDAEKVTQALESLANINKRFMLLASRRFAAIVETSW